MISSFRIESQQLMPCDMNGFDILVCCQPNDTEKEALKQKFDLDLFDVDAIYDADEVPRVETSLDSAFIIWKRPDNVSFSDVLEFQVSSLGIAVKDNKVAFIAPKGELPFAGREFKRIDSVWDCILRVLLHSVHHYQGHLKAIKMMSQELQAKLVTSMENKYLLDMFALSESLIYYYNALEANLAVLSKLRAMPERLRLTADQVELLDDVLIENQQASKQASIYSNVLSGLMDARGSIINNNMNVMLKNLTIINVVFLPLNLIASIGGMSEFSMMTHGIDWRLSYGLFSVAMVLLGWTWWWAVVILDKKRSPHRKRTR